MANSQCNEALVTQTVQADGTIRGLRTVDTYGSILQVRAAPFPERDRIASLGPLTYIAYVVDAARVYTGHGQGNRNIGDRLAPEGLIGRRSTSSARSTRVSTRRLPPTSRHA